MLSNSVKYSPKDTLVEISCRSYDSEWQISATDEGLGISEAGQVKIFDRYYRVDSANSLMVSGLESDFI